MSARTIFCWDKYWHKVSCVNMVCHSSFVPIQMQILRQEWMQPHRLCRIWMLILIIVQTSHVLNIFYPEINQLREQILYKRLTEMVTALSPVFNQTKLRSIIIYFFSTPISIAWHAVSCIYYVLVRVDPCLPVPGPRGCGALRKSFQVPSPDFTKLHFWWPKKKNYRHFRKR